MPMAPLDDLDTAFRLPDHLAAEPDLSRLYEVLIVRMRRESSHVAMNTVQLLLIERIAFNYVQMRYLESLPMGQGFAKASEQKDFNTFWLAMTTEFNKNLRASDAESQSKVIAAMATVVLKVLNEIQDEKARQSLRLRFADEFENAGF